MIKIRKLRLKNFKSFRQAVIPFGKGFTVIAGSNGSGKSNILDAVLFVLGITSLKMLRASKLSELVNYNAKESYANVEMELVDGDKTYSISRQIDAQGKGVYRYNGKRVALNEVTSLLNGLGVKADGYNMVMQGDVTRIIELNPVQRREIIDDLAGLKEFDEKKAEALKGLDKVDQRIKEARIVLNERESYLEDLQRERDAALEFQKLEKELNQSKATLLRQGIDSIKEKEKELEKQAFGLKESKAKKKAKKESLVKEIGSLKGRLNELNEKILEENEKAYAGIGIQAEEARSEKKLCEERVYGKKALVNRLKQRVALLNEKLREAKAKLEENKTKEKDFEKELSETQERLAVKEKLLEEEEAKKASVLSKAREMEAELESLEEELKKAREKFFEKKSEEHALGKELKSINELLERIKAEMQGEGIQQKLRAFASLKKDLKAIEEQGKKLLSFLEEKKPGNAALLKKIADALDSARQRILEQIKTIESLTKEMGLSKIREGKETERKEKSALMEKMAEEKAKLQEKAELIEGERKAKALSLKELREKMLSGSEVEREVNELRNQKNELTVLLDSMKKGNSSLEETKKESVKEISESEEEIEREEKTIAGEEKKAIELGRKVKELEANLEKASRGTLELKAKKEELSGKLEKIEEEKEALDSVFSRLEKQENLIEVERSKNEVKLADLSEEFEAFKQFKFIEGKENRELKQRIEEIDSRINELGAINMRAIDSFDDYAKELLEVKEKAEKLERERLAVLEMIEKIEVKRKSVFMECFNQVNKNFNSMYNSLAEGEGVLSLTEEEDPLNAGMLIEARHYGEKLKSLESMSGGEKTLTALAFLFAIQLHKPSPFYVFDEADAALDKENSVKLAKMINAVSKKSQFIAISHNDPLIKEANQIIGVTLNKDKSSVIGLKLKEAIEKEIGERA